MMEHGWSDDPVESERLYDVVFDPSEAHNLAENPGYADVLAEMRERLERWRAETNDPVSEHQIMEPPDAAVSNDPRHISPGDQHYSARDMIL